MARQQIGSRVPVGSEPTTARTAVGLRMALAALALIGFSLAAWAFAAAAGRPGGSNGGEAAVAIGCALVAVAAAVNLVVLARRRARGEYRNN